MAEIKIVLTDEDKNRLEIEATRLGVTKNGFFRLLFKNWLGEITITRNPEQNKPK